MLFQRNKKTTVVVLTATAILGLVIFYGTKANNGDHERKIIRVGFADINVEIADTPEKTYLGLSGRDYLGTDEGMLFVFDEPGFYPFWMKGMKFRIDIIWVGKDLKVSGIEKNVLPESFPERFIPPAPVKYAIETNAGWSEGNNIKKGDNILLQLSNINVMKIKSSVFEPGGEIPAKYTCDGENISPPLFFEEIPEGSGSLVLIADDPDASSVPVWDHWIIWNIPADTREIPEGKVPDGSVQGTTSFGSQKYGGPCPPHGDDAHRYFFKLYVLDAMLDLSPGSSKKDLEGAMDGHILAEDSLIGLYKRQ